MTRSFAREDRGSDHDLVMMTFHVPVKRKQQKSQPCQD